jgi:deazaflavin-dependent oxidoreductase (nitroreductase family)
MQVQTASRGLRAVPWEQAPDRECRKGDRAAAVGKSLRSQDAVHWRRPGWSSPPRNPVAYLPDDRGYLIWAANGGAPRNPDWYHNLKAHPNTRIEVGSEVIDVAAEVVTGAERKRLFTRAAERYPQLADLARKTNRVIPMLILTPRGSA